MSLPYTDKILITRPLNETPEQRKLREAKRERMPMVSYCVSREVKSTDMRRKK